MKIITVCGSLKFYKEMMDITEKMELEYDDKNEEEILKKVKKVIKREEPDVNIEKI